MMSPAFALGVVCWVLENFSVHRFVQQNLCIVGVSTPVLYCGVSKVSSSTCMLVLGLSRLTN